MHFTRGKKQCVLFVIVLCMALLGSSLMLQAKLDKLSFRYDSGYRWEGDYVYGAYLNETVKTLKDAAENTDSIRIRTEADKYISDTSALRTGLRVQLYVYSTVWNEASLVMRGDISGDGIITSTDYLKIKNHFKGQSLTGAYYEAADITGDGRLLSADYLKLKRYFTGDVVLFPEKKFDEPTPSPVKAYEGPYSEYNGAYGGVDDLGREQYYESQSAATTKDKDVGIFYFLAQGQHPKDPSYVHDNSKIVAADPDAVLSGDNWIAAGGGKVGRQHFWGEPLFGYYTSNDTWVMRKHVQMLTAAGIDYIVFDTTNGYTYDTQVLNMLSLLDEFSKQGWDVPQVVFYTNTDSTVTMTKIYENIYQAHPEYSHLWYQCDGKPLIIGNYPSAEVRSFFTVSDSQWPTEAKKAYGFPWMEFSRWLTKDSVYFLPDQKTLMNVSVAQHNSTVCFSETAWYGGGDRSRSYTAGYFKDLTKEQAMLSGTNLALGFDYALYQDPDNIFITGFNEWIAARQKTGSHPIVFVDCADTDNSRDIEPMNGVLKDNYFMQTANLIKSFKGAAPRVDVGRNTAIDINGSFSQWNGVSAKYTDFTADIADRDCMGFGKIQYTDTSGRNDFELMKVAKDAETVYFYVKTKDAITGQGSDQWMNLFIRSGNGANANWEGFDYVINRMAPSNGKMTVEKSTGGWNWEVVGTVFYKLEANELMLAVPKAMLGISADALMDLQFKWADNCGGGDVMTFYTKGDAAPCGRFTYIYSEVAK